MNFLFYKKMSDFFAKDSREKTLARDFLEQKFGKDSIKGHFLLKRAACGDSFSSFGTSFEFKFEQLQMAMGHGNQLRQFDFLLNEWYGKGATVKDLYNCLTRWQNKKLLLDFGFEQVTSKKIFFFFY